MPESDLELLVNAARQAGEIATGFWQKSPKTWEKDAGAGPVTEADLAVNDMLLDHLTSARPDYGWLSEETADTDARLACDRVFIIDPIDGTRSFIAGEKTWSHSLAVAENGRVVAGVVFLPILDRLYRAAAGAGAFMNDRPIDVSTRTQFAGASVLAARSNFDARFWRSGAPQPARQFRPSLAYRMALVAEGRFDAMLTVFDTWEWDVAAGTLIVDEAGGRISDRHGGTPIFNRPTPRLSGLVAAGAPVHGEICKWLI